MNRVETVNHHLTRGGEFSTGRMRIFHPVLTIPEFCQFLRIAFAIQNGPHDGLSCCSTQITDDVGQLDVHLCQSLLHTLNASCHSCCMLRTQPPVSSQHANIGWGLERVVQ